MAPRLPFTGPKPFASEQDMPQELRDVLKKVRDCKEQAERVQKVYRDRWDELYGLWRNYRRLVNEHASANDKDRGGVVIGAQREWGGPLFIPYAYSLVETTVPRILNDDPRMTMRARKPEAKDSAQAVEQLLNDTQLDIGYDLKLQAIARSGVQFGLGVGKTFWHKQTRKVMQTVPSQSGQGYAATLTEATLYEGPDFEPVDNRDFFWDPVAISIPTARWVIHRIWRDYDYIVSKVKSGEWLSLDLETVKGMASDTSWASLHQTRYQSAGLGDVDLKSDGLHEIWEYHDGERVITVLDGKLIVQNEVTPYYHRELPFQIFRPVHADHEFVGVGSIEPIKHMQYELNTLRGQRRDNATVALQRPFMYREGRADPSTFKIGPSVGIPILGDPQKDIVPLEFGDLPGSAYQEEQAIKEDIERATGISDALAGGAGDGTAGSDTATGIQLVQQAANERLKLMSKNLKREVVRPGGRQWFESFKQHINADDKARTVRLTDTAAPDGFRFAPVGPAQLLDDIEGPIPDADTSKPDDPVGDQQTAAAVHQEFQGNQAVDQRKLSLYVLTKFGVPNPEGMLAPEDNRVDPVLVGAGFLKAGVDPQIVNDVLDAATQAQQAADNPDQAAGGQGAPPPEQAPPA